MKIKLKLMKVIGLDGDLIIALSFLWYLFNVCVFLRYMLIDRADVENFRFGGYEGWLLISVLFTFVPHILCMEKGKHDIFGAVSITSFIFVFVGFLFHYSLSTAVLR